jgi:hypothetical protein
MVGLKVFRRLLVGPIVCARCALRHYRSIRQDKKTGAMIEGRRESLGGSPPGRIRWDVSHSHPDVHRVGSAAERGHGCGQSPTRSTPCRFDLNEGNVGTPASGWRRAGSSGLCALGPARNAVVISECNCIIAIRVRRCRTASGVGQLRVESVNSRSASRCATGAIETPPRNNSASHDCAGFTIRTDACERRHGPEEIVVVHRDGRRGRVNREGVGCAGTSHTVV